MSPIALQAGHLYGGSITWECDGSGDHLFHMTVYRDCDMGAAPSSAQLNVDGHPSINSIPLSLDTSYGIAPDCKTVPGGPGEIQCSGGGSGAIEKVVLSSSPITMTGTPPPSGWTLSWSEQTRSTGPTNLVSPGTKGITLRSKIYEAPGPGSCVDASPRPAEPPVTIRCRGAQVRWNAAAIDPDSDSLSYQWGKALGKTAGGTFNPPTDPVPLTYESGYSFDRPFPGIQSGTGNASDRLDPESGELVIQSPSQGDFNYVVKISAWRAGQKIAEVYQEAGIVLTDCPGSTSSPEILPPFSGSFSDTFQVGQNLNLPIRAVDDGVLQDGSDQTLRLSVESEAFGANYSNSGSGCPNPPCATLSQVPPVNSTDTVETELQWQIDCSHLASPGPGGPGRYRRYDFQVSVSDDHCSVPGYSERRISIYIENDGPAPPPDLNCIKRQGGDLELEWTPLNPSYSSFDAYVIYRASSEGGPYTPIDTLSGIGSSTYTDPGKASGSPVFYYIRSLSGCQGQLLGPPSDTLQRLDLSVADPNNGKAMLSWNELASSDTAPNASTGYYRILKEYPMGTWQVIDSVPYGTTEYDDTIMVCSDSISYRIEVADHQKQCVSQSNIDGGVFSDVLAPAVPEIQSVTVDTSIGKSTVDWDPVPEEDTRGYLILQIIGGTEYVIDTVWGRTNTSYVYSGSNAPATSENFAVAAFDSCYSGSPPRPNTSTRGSIHNSMNLRGTKNECERTITLTWNNYRNWESGVEEYRVYFIGNGSSPVYVGRTQAGDTTMTHGKVSVNEEHCYVVKAISKDGKSSLSDKECFFMDFPEPPSFHYLASASVMPGNAGVEVRNLVDTAGSSISFRLMRKDPQESYRRIKTVPWNGNRRFSITDTSADPGKSDYRYRVVVEDSCGNPLMRSNLGHSIHLTVNADREPPVNVLQWTRYGDWDGNLASYEIHRIDKSTGTDRIIDNVGPMRRSYEHRVGEEVQEESGKYCYYVLAKESGNSYGKNEVARSNEACAFQKPYIHIPNAYIINGASESFNAVTGHVRKEGYRLSIYDRWGEKIFETKDPEEGWKGRDKHGDRVPEGVYVYHFVFRTADGKKIERRGGVTLLHK